MATPRLPDCGTVGPAQARLPSRGQARLPSRGQARLPSRGTLNVGPAQARLPSRGTQGAAASSALPRLPSRGPQGAALHERLASRDKQSVTRRISLLGSSQSKLKRRLQTAIGIPKRHDEVKLKTSLLAKAQLHTEADVVPSWKERVSPKTTPRRTAQDQMSSTLPSFGTGVSLLPVAQPPQNQLIADVQQACQELGSTKAKQAFAAERKKLEFNQRMAASVAAADSSVTVTTARESPDHALSISARSNLVDTFFPNESNSNPMKNTSKSNLRALGRFHRAFCQVGCPTPLLGNWLASASCDGDGDEDEMQDVRVLQLWGQNCGDFVIEKLCECFTQRVSELQDVDLGENMLTVRSARALSSALSPALRRLHLRNNQLGSAGCDAIISMLKIPLDPGHRNLQSLDLSQNGLGDAAVSRLCVCLAGSDAAPELTELGLAENAFGRDHTTGARMRRLLAKHGKLAALDLYFNFLHGNGAYEVLYGVYENNDNSGSLKRLDISWNQLGVSGSINVSGSWRIAQMLATILRDGDNLAHLDLSYNRLQAQEMAVVAEALSANSTLWGLHLVGNAAAIDADGYVIPMAGLLPESADVSKSLQKPTGPSQMDQVDPNKGASGKHFWSSGSSWRPGTSKQKKMGQKAWDRDVEGIQIEMDVEKVVCLPTIPSRGPSRAMTLDENALPSGALQSVTVGQPLKAKEKVEWLNEVCNSIPTNFHQKEALARPETVRVAASGSRSLTRRTYLNSSRSPFGCCWICESWVEVELRWTPGLSGPWLDNNDIKEVFVFLSFDNFAKPVTLHFDPEENSFVGFKMLPPSNVPIAIIFQVGSQLHVAQNLPLKTLCSPLSVRLVSDFGGHAETSQVNCLSLAEWASAQRGGHSEQMPSRLLTVTEDPQEQGRLVVAPRGGAKKNVAKKLKEKPPWTMAQSVWAPHQPDISGLLDRCFSKDWALLQDKLEKVLDAEIAEKLKTILEPNYRSLYFLYAHYAWSGLGQDKEASVNVRLADWVRILAILFPDENKPKRRDTDAIFSQSQFVPAKMAEKNKMSTTKKIGLVRYQFIEALIRVGQLVYCKGTGWSEVDYAMQLVMSKLDDQASHIEEELQQWRHELFCEKSDKICKRMLQPLRTVYDFYRPRYHESRPDLHGLVVTSWVDLFGDADAFDESFTARDASILFGRYLIPIADEYSDNIFLHEMGFKEFLMNIGGVVKARESYLPGMLAHCLEEFITDHIIPLCEKIVAWQKEPVAEQLPGFDLPTEWLRILSAELKKVFQMADDDLSGCLSCREFITAFGGKYMRTKLKELELDIVIKDETTLIKLFEKFDIDESGDVSFLEALHGLAKIKEENKNAERVINILQNIFEAADKNGDGDLTRQEFLATFESPAIQKMIRVNGINFGGDDAVELFDSIDVDKSDAVTLDELLEGYMTMKNSERQGDRAAGFLQQVFLDADADGSGTLTMKEFCDVWKQPRIQKKAFAMGLTGGSDWKSDALESYFASLDDQSDGMLTLDELLSGFFRLRDQFRLRTLAEEQDKWEAKAEKRASLKGRKKDSRHIQDAVAIESF